MKDRKLSLAAFVLSAVALFISLANTQPPARADVTSGGGGAAAINAATTQLAWNTGLGAITHVLGPTDQELKVVPGTGRDLRLGLSGRTTYSVAPIYGVSGALDLYDSTGAGRVSVASTGVSHFGGTHYFYKSSTDVGLAIKVTTVAKAYNSTLFDAAATTDNVAIWTQPAGSILVAAYYVLDTQFANGGTLTDLDVTLGTVASNAGVISPPAHNLTSDAAASKYTGKGGVPNLFDQTAGTLYVASDTAYNGYATSVGANLSTLTAGQVTFYFFTLELP